MLKYFRYTIFSLLIIFTIVGLFTHRKYITSPIIQELFTPAPCSKPFVYQIDSIDPKFNITKTELISDLNKASSVWSNVIGRPLFVFSTTSTENTNKIAGSDIIKINLIYDYRQRATDSIKSLGITISNDQKTYNDLKSQYNSLTTDYQSQKTIFQAMISKYQTDLQNYNQSVSYWNSRGGAPKNEYNSISEQKTLLQNELVQINSMQNSLNSKVDTINSVVTVLNQIARKINATIVTYNEVGSSAGQEFNEGEYIQTSTSTRINIYQYDNKNELVRVLEHEFGHALGLGHVTDEQAIMYSINKASNLSLSGADIAELKNICNSM